MYFWGQLGEGVFGCRVCEGSGSASVNHPTQTSPQKRENEGMGVLAAQGQRRNLSDRVAWESHPQVQVKRGKRAGGRERGQMVPQSVAGDYVIWGWGKGNYKVVGAKMEYYHWSTPNPKSCDPAALSLHPYPLHF